MAYKVDRVADLDREAIRASVIDRFSVERMTDGYEAVYARVLEGGDGRRGPWRRDGWRAGDRIIPAERLSSRRADRTDVAAGR